MQQQPLSPMQNIKRTTTQVLDQQKPLTNDNFRNFLALSQVSPQQPKVLGNNALVIDPTKIVKKGCLFKKGNLFKRYKDQYLFYLEDPCYLKYGKKDKPLSSYLDLTQASIQLNKESRTKFKVVTPKQTIALRAESANERDQWVTAIKGLIGTTTNREVFVLDIEDSMIDSSRAPGKPPRNTVHIMSSSPPQKPTLGSLSDMLDRTLLKTEERSEQLDTLLTQNEWDMEAFQKLLTTNELREGFLTVLKSTQDIHRFAKDSISLSKQSLSEAHTILESIAQIQIDKDPLDFVRRESVINNKPNKKQRPVTMKQSHRPANINMPDDIMILSDGDDDDEDNEGYAQNPMSHMDFIDELETVYQDANDEIVAQETAGNKQGHHQQLQLIEEEEETKNEDIFDPEERERLPFFKDPKIKFSIWTVIKDSIGKDLTKISLPVYFNQPVSGLQMQTATCENLHLLDKAIQEQDQAKRLAYLTVYCMVQANHMERAMQKPFNPMLGETYEFVKPGGYKMIAELVVHHPPIIAYHVEGESGYRRSSTLRPKPKFVKGSISVVNQNKDYIELLPHNEKFEIQTPGISINNIIIGTPYLDVIGKTTIKNIACPKQSYAVLEFFKRGWSANSHQKAYGEIFSGNNVVYKIEGRWSESASIINCKTGEREVVWEKPPYPENWQFMYGMTRYIMQLNYLPSQMKKYLAPTDSRLRPDQRALENGDLKLAAEVKNILEEKQRAVRRYNEKHNIEHQPVYFDKWENPDHPGEVYYKYNGTYFEKDRQNLDWSRCPDIYSDKLLPAIKEFDEMNKKNKK